jgi:hypothetical protein
MSSFCIEDLGELVDKLIVDILFLVALELNIVNREKKQDAIHVGKHIDPTMINPSQMKIIIFFPNGHCIISSDVECHCCCITRIKQF